MLTNTLSLFKKFIHHSLSAFGFNERRCAICREPYIPESSYPYPSPFLCKDCQKDLIFFSSPKCGACGLPQAQHQKNSLSSTNGLLCHSCLKTPPPWQGLAYFGLYTGMLREAILALKYSGSLHLCHLFSDLLLECSKCLPYPDLIVPVPVSTSRLKKRGYNQALEISRLLSKKSSIPFSSQALYRTKDTGPQEGLNAVERKKNIHGVFQATNEVNGRSIWILDDVMTTGSTLAECSKALLAMGAKSVSLLFLARTI